MTFNLENENRVLLLVLVAGLLVLLMAYVVIRRLAKTRTLRKTRRVMRKLGHKMLADIMLPDGTDNLIHVDYLLLTAVGIFVIDIKDYTGMLFGGEKVDQWTQMIGRNSYRFENPLFQNESRVLAVRNLVGDVPVHGYVVFTNAGQFPKGVPGNTFMLDTFLSEVGYSKRGSGKVPPAALEAWGNLKGVMSEGVNV